jgi:hypothetical protein
MGLDGLSITGIPFGPRHYSLECGPGVVRTDVGDVDFESNNIRVSKSYNKAMDEIKSTKTEYRRNVPMSPELRNLFEDHGVLYSSGRG